MAFNSCSQVLYLFSQAPSKSDCRNCYSTPVLTSCMWTNSRKEVPDILRSERRWRVVLVCFVTWQIERCCSCCEPACQRRAAPNPRLKLVSAVWLHWRWVVLQKSVDSKAWTCLHFSQRYAFTDQPYKQGKCPYPCLQIQVVPQLLTPPCLLSDVHGASGITLAKNGITVQISLSNFPCVVFWSQSSHCSECVCVCACDPCIYTVRMCTWKCCVRSTTSVTISTCATFFFPKRVVDPSSCEPSIFGECRLHRSLWNHCMIIFFLLLFLLLWRANSLCGGPLYIGDLIF